MSLCGQTALYCAVENSHRSNPSTGFNLVEYLIRHGANLEARDANGYTPLIFAVIKRNIPAIRTLLAHGANVNARDNNGRTALHHVIMIRGNLTEYLAEFPVACHAG